MAESEEKKWLVRLVSGIIVLFMGLSSYFAVADRGNIIMSVQELKETMEKCHKQQLKDSAKLMNMFVELQGENREWRYAIESKLKEQDMLLRHSYQERLDYYKNFGGNSYNRSLFDFLAPPNKTTPNRSVAKPEKKIKQNEEEEENDPPAKIKKDDAVIPIPDGGVVQ